MSDQPGGAPADPTTNPPATPPADNNAAQAVPPTKSVADATMEWTRRVIALVGLVVFGVAFYVAATKVDYKESFNILVGSVVSLVSTISGFYFGSSAGSQKKDDAIHQALQTAAQK